MIHELKIAPNYFADVISGKKTFETRKNDRPFHIGDMLALNEFDGQYYTGNSCLVYVDYILNNKEYCKKDYVTMSIKPCATHKYAVPRDPYRIVEDYSVPYATKAGDTND